MAVTKSGSKPAAPKNVDEYLATLHPEARSMVEELRGIIRAAAPEAVEGISYGMPVFRHHGNLVWVGGYKKHCSLFGLTAATLDKHRDQVAPYRTPKGAVQFKLGDPVPRDLVSGIVKAQAAENEAVSGK